MEPTKQLEEILPRLVAIVDEIEPSQLGNPTPCRDFSVRGVLDHMIGLGGAFSYLFRGEEPPASEAPDRRDGVPAAEFAGVMESLLQAVHAPGAMERTISAPVGEMPGEAFARLVAFDGLIHGWDLATSTGQHYDPPSEVVEAVDRFARTAITPEMRDGHMFAKPTPVPDGATRLESLVAFSGRRL